MTKEEFNIQDERLLGQFFEKERSKVLIVLRNRLSISTEDAEDIYQDACIALFNNIQKGKLKTLTCSLSTYFTQICLNMGSSGGTESDNLALIGTAFANCRAGRHLITTQIEHPAILQTMQYLEKQLSAIHHQLLLNQADTAGNACRLSCF